MKKSILLFTIVAGLFSGCKKKSETAPAPVIAAADEPGTYRGFLIASTWTNSIGGSLLTGQGAEARFYNLPVKQFGAANDVNLNLLSVNNLTLTNKDMFVYMLRPAPHNLDLTTDTWAVNGNGNIPSFEFTNNTPYPSCSDFNVIPDSISKSKGCSFTVDKVAGITSGWISLGDGGQGYLTYTLAPGTNHFEIKPSELTALASGTAGAITLGLVNTTDRSFSGKNFQFTKQAYLTKPIKITP